jgi:hypothetical protein
MDVLKFPLLSRLKRGRREAAPTAVYCPIWLPQKYCLVPGLCWATSPQGSQSPKTKELTLEPQIRTLLLNKSLVMPLTSKFRASFSLPNSQVDSPSGRWGLQPDPLFNKPASQLSELRSGPGQCRKETLLFSDLAGSSEAQAGYWSPLPPHMILRT